MTERHGHGVKHPRLVDLEEMVRDGTIDTIVVAITDMQGRLMGKRVQGQAFLDGVISHGAHFCTCLLGTDMEMSTPEGFDPGEIRLGRPRVGARALPVARLSRAPMGGWTGA